MMNRRTWLLMAAAALAGWSRAPMVTALEPPAPATSTIEATASSVDAIEIDPKSIKLREAKAYIVNLPIPEEEADGPAALKRSQWLLLEDDIPLGPGHCLHASVAADGAGRYSHWKSSLVFSTSDGTDPRTNGRRYTFVKPVDHEGHAIHFPGAGAILILHAGDRLWWRDPEPLQTFMPRFGARRQEVNPSMPRRDGTTLIFDEPGEICLRSPHRSVRVLVLHDDEQQWARQIVGLVAANTTGGRSDEPMRIDGGIDWPNVSRAQFHHLFSTEDSLDVACGQSARLVCVLAESIGLKARYCGWLGSDEEYAGHIGVEILNPVRQTWEYYDPHFGLSARDRVDALTLARNLNGAYAGREAEAFTVLVDKIDSARLAPQWASFKAALQMWPDPARRTSIVLLMGDAIPPTVDPDQFAESAFLSASTDLGRFRMELYEPAGDEAGIKEPSR